MKRFNKETKKTFTVKLLTFIILCAIMLSSCQKPEPDVTEPDNPFVIDERYTIVRSDVSDDGIKAAQYILKAIETLTGIRLKMTTDYVKDGEDVVPNEFEILVGDTNRKESYDLYSSLKRSDWCYIAKEGQILISGGSKEANLEAAKAFCQDLFGYTEENPGDVKTLEIKSVTTRRYSHTYPITSVNLAGHPITDYVLAVPTVNKTYRAIADKFNDMLAENSGIQLRAKPQSELSDGDLYIKLGENETDKSPFAYSVTNSNGILDFSGDVRVISEAIEHYFESYLTETEGDVSLSLPTETLSGYGGEEYGLSLLKESTQTVTEGIEYKKLIYKDENALIVTAYALIIEPGNYMLINATPNGGKEIYNVNATTVDAAIAAEKQGYKVIAGVNADFFASKTDFKPAGICVKKGEVLQEVSDRPFFGMTSSGKPIIGEGSEFSAVKADIVEAVGGQDILLKNGKINDVDYQAGGYTRHPRTSVGYDKDGRIYLLVIDGRQPAFSNGASLTDVAIIMLSLGATEALNLDGGGSSTFILDDGDTFKTINSPSSGSLRRVYNSLLVVVKD